MIKLLNSTIFHVVLGCLCVGIAAAFLSGGESEKPKFLVQLEQAEAQKRAAGTWSQRDEMMKTALVNATPEQLAEIEKQFEGVRSSLDKMAADLRK